MTLKERLAERIHEADISEITHSLDTSSRQELYALLFDDDKRTSDNAAWVMTHLQPDDRRWVEQYQSALIDEAMSTSSDTKRRLLLTLVSRQKIQVARTDFLDFCLEQMMSVANPTGIRSVCMRLACAICLPYPELRGELRRSLELMPNETITTGLRAARRNVMAALS